MKESDLELAALYLLGGLLTMVYSVSLGAQGRAHFRGVTQDTAPTLGVLETALLWPYALVVNLRGG